MMVGQSSDPSAGRRDIGHVIVESVVYALESDVHRGKSGECMYLGTASQVHQALPST